MAVVTVNLPHHRYDCVIEPGAMDHLGELTRKVAPHDRCAVVADAHVATLYGDKVDAALKAAGYEVVGGIIPPGEQHKNLDTVRTAYDLLLSARLERRSPVIALGGGVIGDTVGFVAATYLRGVPLVQCPTTLLAMVDSSVGGKVGVNVPQGKNLIGAFHHPNIVVIDPLVLATLPPRELRCGLAECVKHGIIRDASLFDWIDKNLAKIQAVDPTLMSELISRNVTIKAGIVMADEMETGERAHLNFGHTFAHAIEATSGYGKIEHGEAVALGMVAATKLAVDTQRCPPEVLTKLTSLLDRIGLPTSAELAPLDQLMAAMMLDKKVKDNRIRFVLPQKLGVVSVVDDTPTDAIKAAWSEIFR